jgi:hypothetical protein
MRDQGFDHFSHNPEWMAVLSMDWWAWAASARRFLYFAFTLPHTPNSGDALIHAPVNLPVRVAAHASSSSPTFLFVWLEVLF